MAEPRDRLPAWTARDLAAIHAAPDAGDLPAEVTGGDGTTYLVCRDEVADLTAGKPAALHRYLAELLRQGRGDDLVTIEDPKDRRVPVQYATVAQLEEAARDPEDYRRRMAEQILMPTPDRAAAIFGAPDECTTEAVTHRHRPGQLAPTATNQMLGALGQRGTTACGQPDALDQRELDMWYAEWHVPAQRRARVAELPDCPDCFPGETTAPASTARPVGTVTIHQLDAHGACWREFDHHPVTEAAREALYARIERGYRMASTMVTRDGEYEFGAHGTHPDPPTAQAGPQGTDLEPGPRGDGHR